MTIQQFPLRTSNGWTGVFDAERLPEQHSTTRTGSNNKVSSGRPVDDMETHKDNENYLNGAVTASHRKDEDSKKNTNGDTIEETNDEEDDGQKVLCLDCCCCRFFPRISLLFVGILFPLWTLISISTIFGMALAAVESPQEVRLNDQFMASRAEILAYSVGAKNFTRKIPRICLEIFLEKSRQKNIEEISKTILTTYLNESDSEYPPRLREVLNLTELIVINVTDLDEHMKACGIAADPVVDRLLSSLIDAYQNLPGGLTFNWIRCFDKERDGLNYTILRPQSQNEYYQSVWEAHQQELFQEFLEEEMNRTKRFSELNVNDAYAKYRAFNRSINEATGGTGCESNIAASVWFWFTVMTTIGYGNQAPVTWEGRGLIFTLGFLSILLFGIILQRAGRVTSALFDDLLSRSNLRILTRPWFLCAIWGFIYYGYMTINAYYVKEWKQSRLGEAFSLTNGYWFSFISFTTIGLGDIFIEPEVIIGIDIVSLPFFYLVGFTFFAAFLENIVGCFPKGKKLRLLDALIERIQSRKDSKC